jgi:NADP-dependent 3-hydroxy acid dehydrogenase YdfG
MQRRVVHLGDRVFTRSDQLWFAEVSGDRNPMHLDAMAARRLLTGLPIVHGLHLLLSSLERWRDPGPVRQLAFSCSFENPVSVGETVSFLQSEDSRGRVVIDAVVDGVLCARTLIADRVRAAGRLEPAARSTVQRSHAPFGLSAPMDETPEHIVGRRYEFAVHELRTVDAFPNLRRLLGEEPVSSLAALSYVVGMVCPGLHSVLSSLRFEVADAEAAAPTLGVSVQEFRANVRMFDLAFDGPIRGRLEAFRRQPPQPQPSIADLSGSVSDGEFRGSRSLIVGGSRGLGELTAKLIAAGGGGVTITYRTGGDDARRVKAEIEQGSTGSCEIEQLDVLDRTWDALAARGFNAVYFFPTPRIFRKSAGVFSPERFRQFLDVYVTAFAALCAALEKHAATPVRVFFPSSIAVTERPKGLTEYAMAKAAAEILIDDLNRSYRQVSILSGRLPRLSTDQTLTLLEVPAASNVETLLPIVRSMYR